MAGAAPVTSSTKETTNYARLCRLLVDVGSQALRDTFDSIHAPGSLHTILANPPAQTILQSLYKPKKGKKKILNPTQWGKLYPAIPSSVSSANFDITLLMILLRNICGLSPPATGWDTLPPPADTSAEADIARVKYYRNVVYGHAEQASVDDTSFNNYWHDIKATLVRLGGTSYGDAIDHLQNACMDPEVEEHYKELLQQWKKDEDSIQDQLNEMESDMKYVRKKLDDLTEIVSPKRETIVEEIANCESDIAFFAERHDADTRQWLLEDFSKWFSDPGDSRAYVLLGDPGVGKSVMAGVLARRSRKAGNLGAAYFCRHNDGTRNDPRCLLGTISSQLCECNSEYNSIMGGEGGIRKLLGNSNLGVQELFTKLLQEPLGKCHSTFCHQRKLVVVDALDETQYESREDFLDLIMNRFPLLPNWLVFFITSRPENTVQLSLKKYNPCVRICAGNVEHDNLYQQHEQDIKLFLRNSVDFSRLSFSVDDLAKKCKGSFLYAFYIAKDLKATMQSGKSFQLVDLFPGDFDNFLRKNFKRVFDKVGSRLFKKLFGCAIAAPAPLPVSFISYVLQREKSIISKQRVVDALSLFMGLSKTFAFLHNLIPAWLTDEDKAREMFIDRTIEANYLKDVILEILFDFIHEQSQDVALIKDDLLDYVLRVGIRFLSGFPGKDSSETVFSCLTSFRYIQNRIQSRRIEIYSLIEDFKLAADCQFNVDGKKEILLGVCSALERNIYVLLECPYLLNSCLQNAPKAVQEKVVIPDGVSTTWLQWNSWALPSMRLHHKSYYAVSPDGKLLAKRQGEDIFLFDSCSLEVISKQRLGPVSNCVEFSPDGKFLFLGQLDKWFSLEGGNVEEFPQFSGNKEMYEWGSFTLDKQWIVVKRYNFLPESSHRCCLFCLLNFLCLWAAEEIGQRQESETICGCFPDRLLVQSLPPAWEDQNSPVPAMRILLNILRRTHHDEWCSLLEKLQLNYPFGAHYETVCRHCPSRINHETPPTMTVVRGFIISHYSMIFKYQVWDVQAGKSALEQTFSSGVQLSPFTYFCHLGTALEECGALFSGIDRALSLCNIALLNTVCHHLFFFKSDYCRNFIWQELNRFDMSINKELDWLELLTQFEEPEELESLERLEECKRNLPEELNWVKWNSVEQLRRLERLEQISSWCEVFLDPIHFARSADHDLKQNKELGHLQQLQLERLARLERLGQRGQLEEIKRLRVLVGSKRILELKALLRLEQSERWRILRSPMRETTISYSLHLASRELKWPIPSLPERFAQFKQSVHTLWYHLESNGKLKFLEAFHFGTKTFTSAPLELQNLPDVEKTGLFTSILPCVSPDGKWVAIRLDGDETTVQLYRGQHQRQHSPYSRNLVHVIKKVEHFAFTYDSVFFLYLTVQRSLHALSLLTGTILTSVSDVRPLSFIPERQVGYRFRVDDEENKIFVKDIPSGFLSCFFVPVVKEPIQATFAFPDTILVLYSDSMLALIKKGARGIAIVSETSLTHPSGGSQQVTKGQFSPDGEIIVTHQGTRILLYGTLPGSAEASTDHGKCPDTVFETNDEYIVLHFTFSADSTLLLFCIRRNIGLSFFVWNVQKKVLSASFDSPGLTSEDCCYCFSFDNKELIICSEFYIEFWDHSSHPCRLLRKVETDVPYTEVDKFTHCTISPGNDLLAYCITDKIFLYPFKTSTDQSMLQLPRAHLGKVEFCQFLRGNRYLISYGVDGTVFLWDLSERKVATFAKIAQGRESIVSMGVSAEGDKVVCVTSFGRLNVIKLCGLKDAVLSKLALPKEMGSEKMTEACRGQVGEPTEAIQNPTCSDNTKDLDVAELIEEMEFMLCSDDNENSDEESDELLD